MDIPEKALRRLNDDRLVWLTTVDGTGTPQTSLVWFLWGGDEVLVYSGGGKPKVRNILERPRVSLAFNSNDVGGDVVVIDGDARVSAGDPPVHENRPYLARYEGWITGRLGLTPEQFTKRYDTAIRIRPTRVRAW
jgi:PPOX class probable F420-dependent enzyme